jgi:hypothetical protein
MMANARGLVGLDSGGMNRMPFADRAAIDVQEADGPHLE